MAKRTKPAAKRGQTTSKLPKVGAGELLTLLDFVRYAVSRFVEAKLVFAHGTTDPVAEAAFLVCEALHLHPDQFESFVTARVTAAEGKKILDLIARRVTTRKPTAYLVNKIYMRGLPFHVDERTHVPRSFMADLPRECRAEPKLAFDGGADGIDIVRRILDEAEAHLTPQGGLLCEIGRCRPQLEAAYPQLPLLWLDTADSEGEVFWIAAADL